MFLILSPKKFQEAELSYISGKLYSEPEAYSEHCQTSMMEHFIKIATKRTFLKHFLIFSYISQNGAF